MDFARVLNYFGSIPIRSYEGFPMAKNGFKILDSDMHIMEPPDLWEKYIDGKFKSRAPRGITSKNVRDLRLAHPDGTEWARKSSSKPWTSRASMSRFSTPPGD